MNTQPIWQAVVETLFKVERSWRQLGILDKAQRRERAVELLAPIVKAALPFPASLFGTLIAGLLVDLAVFVMNYCHGHDWFSKAPKPK